MIENLKIKAKQLKKQLIIVFLAYKHKEVKWYKKVFILLILIYAASPIDLIPDFIPVLGLLDDIILIPIGIIFVIKIIPKNIWQECTLKAEEGIGIDEKYKKMGAILIGLIWLIIIVMILKALI